MRKSFLVFGQPLIEQDEVDEFLDSVRQSWLGTGKKVARFEQDFAAFKKIEHAAAVNSCTAALHLSCLALGIRPGDEIITTAMTFCATINAIIHSGATPVLCDIDPESLNIDPKEVESKITDKTKAILVVHFAGRPCNMDKIMDIARKNKLFVIEDCAHAIEAEYNGMPTGTIGDLGCFSFYSTKNITTGEGGMVVSKNKELIAKIKTLALHGMTQDAWSRFSDEGYKHYYVVDAGFKYNMMDLQAAFGIHQLKRIEKYWERRKEIWDTYNKAFANLPIGLPAADEEGTKNAYHLYTLRINKDRCGISRDGFLQELHKLNIGSGVHYLAIPQHPYYKEHFAFREEDYSNAVGYGMETISIPISPKLTDEDVQDVIEAVSTIIHRTL
ncbi:MAG: DegT/DnrJ/EryC1/StrS family aminotransferase [Bacteroidota bacterium]